MTETALNDEILLKVDKPARYIGNEVNMVKKNPVDVDIRFAICFPDVYEIGMSHLGIQILYDMFNQREDVYFSSMKTSENGIEMRRARMFLNQMDLYIVFLGSLKGSGLEKAFNCHWMI